ncbi:GntR family transcriptional regulator [Duganella sp.]|uniref:GntR family transcriptional regulator n=1 Tax=Duganella sp. TaxID=1904440 RepID=UPI0039C89B58
MALQPMPGAFSLDRSRNATAQVFEHLREKIVTNVLEPGTVLARQQLADYFKLSITPIRDALLRLEEERLVDIYPQHLTRVSAIDLASARQAHVLRLSVELETAHQLCQRRPPTLDGALADLLARQRMALERDDLETFARADLEFHQTLYMAADVADLWHLVRRLSGNLDRLRRLHLPLNSKARRILDDHGEIAGAIAAGASERARDAVRRHLSGTLSELDALREKYPDFVLPPASI